jgi:hypothetical protein
MVIASNSLPLPEDSASLRTLVEQLQVELLRVQLELEHYKKLYYGPRADRLHSDKDVAQMLLCFLGFYLPHTRKHYRLAVSC